MATCEWTFLVPCRQEGFFMTSFYPSMTSFYIQLKTLERNLEC